MTIIKWNGRDVPEELRELAPGEYFVEDATASQHGGGDEGDASWEDWIAKSVGQNVRATAERVANAAKVTEFDRWVGDNNIPSQYEYGKGWWDYVELIRRFASKHCDVTSRDLLAVRSRGAMAPTLFASCRYEDRIPLSAPVQSEPRCPSR